MPKLDWLTRAEDERAAASVPYRLLEAVPELSYGDEQTENMLIQGDNLEALKALLPFYAGRVKCIFIDPPYNTRSAVSQQYDDNLEHTQWLGMMYPRLELLREFLAEDGVFMCILDERETHYAKVICDEIFGRQNFIGQFIWEKKRKPSFLNSNFASITDYIICYASNRQNSPTFIAGSISDSESYPFYNAGNSRSDLNFPAMSVTFPGYDNQIIKAGDMSKKTSQVILRNDVSIENETNVNAFELSGEWRYSQQTVNEFVAAGDSILIRSLPFRPRRLKSDLSQGKKMHNLLSRAHYDMDTNEDATKESEALFGASDSFDYPKPEKLLHILIGGCTNLGDLVLDSFLGSGTTAAVAHKMGRRYIGIEMGEHAETHCVPRLKKVVDGEQGGISEAVGWQGGGGFRFYRLGSPIFDEHGHIHSSIRFDHLAAHVWFAETRTPIHQKRKRSPLLGKHGETAFYLLYNGILGDKRPDGGNVLTRKVLSELPSHDGPKVIYGECSRLSTAALKELGVIFKQTPYDVKAR